MSVQTLPLIEADGLVLAGGRAQRMGGVDKGLQMFDDRALAQHAMERLQSQLTGRVRVNANRHFDLYRPWAADVLPDPWPDFRGPLAGFLAGLEAGQKDWTLMVPCDSPCFPMNLAQSLWQAAHEQGRVGAMVEILEEDGQWRLQPVFCLLRRDLAPSLRDYIESGGRKIDAWTQPLQLARVRFEDAAAFVNLNTFSELEKCPRP